MDRAMRKRVFGHMWRPISVCASAQFDPWSGPILSAKKNHWILQNVGMENKSRMILCVCAGWSETAHFAHVGGYVFPWRGPYSRTSMARTPLGLWKIVRVMGSSSQWRLIMVPGQEANIANSGKSIDLLHNNCILSVLIRIASKSNKKASLNICCFFGILDKFRRDSKTSSN